VCFSDADHILVGCNIAELLHLCIIIDQHMRSERSGAKPNQVWLDVYSARVCAIFVFV